MEWKRRSTTGKVSYGVLSRQIVIEKPRSATAVKNVKCVCISVLREKICHQGATDGDSRDNCRTVLHRVPKEMVTDSGVKFSSRSFKKFLKELGVRHQFTIPTTGKYN